LFALWPNGVRAETARNIVMQNDSGTKVGIYWIHPVSYFRGSFVSSSSLHSLQKKK